MDPPVCMTGGRGEDGTSYCECVGGGEETILRVMPGSLPHMESRDHSESREYFILRRLRPLGPF